MSHPMTWEYDLCGPSIPGEPARTVYEQGQAAMRAAHSHQNAQRHCQAAAHFLSAAADAERLFRLADRYGDTHRATAWRTVAELRKRWHDRERAQLAEVASTWQRLADLDEVES